MDKEEIEKLKQLSVEELIQMQKPYIVESDKYIEMCRNRISQYVSIKADLEEDIKKLEMKKQIAENSERISEIESEISNEYTKVIELSGKIGNEHKNIRDERKKLRDKVSIYQRTILDKYANNIFLNAIDNVRIEQYQWENMRENCYYMLSATEFKDDIDDISFYDSEQSRLYINPTKYNNIDNVFINAMIYTGATKNDIDIWDVKNFNKNHIGFYVSDTFQGYGLNEGMISYLREKILKEDNNIQNSAILLIIKDLVKLYGEDVIIDAYIFGSEKLEVLIKKDGKDFNEFLKIVDDISYSIARDGDKDILDRDSLALAKYEEIGRFIEEIKEVRGISYIESEWKKKTIKPEVMEEVNKYIALISRLQTIPNVVRNKICKNLKMNIKDIEEKDLEKGYNGVCYIYDGIIELDSKRSENPADRLKTLLHELTHIATSNTTYMENGKRIVKLGVREIDDSGKALNEGMTEFIAQKIYMNTENPELEISYPDLVAVVFDLAKIYGEEFIYDAMVSGPEKLEKLMKEDGKDYTELREIMDDFYALHYKDFEKDGLVEKKNKNPEIYKSYKRIGDFIEEIKQSRGMQNEKSIWKKQYEILEKIHKKDNMIISFFQIVKRNFSKTFVKNEEPLVLIASADDGFNVIVNENDKNEFLARIKVEETEFNQIDNKVDRTDKNDEQER